MLDQILVKATRLADASVLFAGPGRFCGPGPGVLLVHRKDGSWELPGSVEVAADVHLDEPAMFGDSLLARVDAQFIPKLTEKHDDFCWTHPDFALSCASSTHPSALRAIKQFIAKSGDLPSGAKTMDLTTRGEFSAAQLKAQRCYQAFNENAPPPMQGEAPLSYRARLAQKFQEHSRHKDVNLALVGCGNALRVVEDQIYADAAEALYAGRTAPPGVLIPITKNDAAGRPITKYVGNGFFGDLFAPPVRIVDGGIAALADAARPTHRFNA
jgi:hypothetical protein